MEMEGMKRGSAVWRRVDDNGGVCGEERLGNGYSAYGEGSDCVDLKRFRESARPCVSEQNGRWGSEIYENRSMGVAAAAAAAAAEKEECSRESMFEKAVTPSDVGKLNRLVIPKHHAEKYFPLDTTSNDKGLLLTFEDNTGKTWRFRYSYWNSSQSYVLTKGWSRFVKEKKLDAGDIVSFERSTDARNAERFYITWKRRPPSTLQIQPPAAMRRLSLPAPTFRYSPFVSLPLQSPHTLLRTAASSASSEWMSVPWPRGGGGGGGAFWRLPMEEPSRVTRYLPAAEGNSGREPHDFMQLQVSGDRSSPVENGGGELRSKKGVRLFGVNL